QIQRRVAINIVSKTGMAESILQVVEIAAYPLMTSGLIHRSAPKQRRPDTLSRTFMQCVVDSVLHSLLFGVAVTWSGTWILICSLILIGNLVCLPIFEATSLQRQVVGQIVVHIDLIKTRRIFRILWTIADIS